MSSIDPSLMDNFNELFNDPVQNDDFEVEEEKPKSITDEMDDLLERFNSTESTNSSSYNNTEEDNEIDFDIEDLQKPQQPQPRFNKPQQSDPYMDYITEEQKKQKTMQLAMSRITGTTDEDPEFTDEIDKEEEEEEKAVLLEKIYYLRSLLEEDNERVDNIPTVTSDAPLSQIKAVARMYESRNKRKRTASIFEDLFNVACMAMEYFFDGEKDYFGVKPDMRGYSQTANMKLRRMQNETSTLVTNFTTNNGISPLGMIALELVPSAIYYSSRNKSNYNLTQKVSQDEFDASIASFANKDE